MRIGHGPKIIVLDEPTANLDPKSTKELLRILEDLKGMGRTIIISTHNLDLASRLDASRIYLLNKTIIAGTREISYRINAS